MNLTAADLDVLYYTFARFVGGRTAAGKPVPQSVRLLLQRIEIMMSATGHETGCGAEQSEQELIGTAQAAHILGCDPRHVRRLTNDLDGCRINGRWTFTKSVVQQYEESRAARRASESPSGGIPRRTA